MIAQIITNVVWPPGYYIMRDRAPFFLTLLYLYKDRIPEKVQQVLGYYLFAATCLLTFGAGALYYLYDDMTLLTGIAWSAPSPIEWGLFIIASTLNLRKRVDFFEAYYLSFIAAFAGGYLYEFLPLLTSGFNWFIFFKVNAVKVFFVEFQVICVPWLIYHVYKTKEYYANRLLLPVVIGASFFYAVKTIIEHYVRMYLIYSWRWYIRIPAIIALYVYLDGVREEKIV